MKTHQLGEVILERDFQTRDADGNTSAVKLRIGKPHFEEAMRGWNCVRQIIGLGDEKVRPGYGVDSIQALLETLKMAEAELRVMAKHEHKQITWLGGDDLGMIPDRSSPSKRDK
jgi:hypothetical protein